jgi:hypothetical protein
LPVDYPAPDGGGGSCVVRDGGGTVSWYYIAVVGLGVIASCTEPPPGGVPVAAFVRDAGAACFSYRYLDMDPTYWAGWPSEGAATDDDVLLQCSDGTSLFEMLRLTTGECVFLPGICGVEQASGVLSSEDPRIAHGDPGDCVYDTFIEQGPCPGERPFRTDAFEHCEPPPWPWSDCGYVPSR